MQAIKSPFIQSSELWSAEDQVEFNKAQKKTMEIQQKINSTIAHIIYSPQIEEKFKNLSGCIQQYIPGPISTPTDSELNPLKDVMRFLNKQGKIEINDELAKKIDSAYKTADSFMTDTKSLLFTNFKLIREFFVSFKNFHEKNQAQCSELLSSKLKDIEEHLSQLDEKYLSHYRSQLKTCEVFFSARSFGITENAKTERAMNVENIILVLSTSLTKPHQYTKTRTDNPMEVAPLMYQNLINKAENKRLKQLTESEEFEKEAISELEKILFISKRYMEAKDEKEKYAVALEILNKNLSVSMPIHLDSLCIVSRNSKELQLYFRNATLSICKSVNEFKEEEDMQDEKPEECVIS